MCILIMAPWYSGRVAAMCMRASPAAPRVRRAGAEEARAGAAGKEGWEVTAGRVRTGAGGGGVGAAAWTGKGATGGAGGAREGSSGARQRD